MRTKGGGKEGTHWVLVLVSPPLVLVTYYCASFSGWLVHVDYWTFVNTERTKGSFRGTHRLRDLSSKGRIIQETHRQE
jgi:hypothetical protein